MKIKDRWPKDPKLEFDALLTEAENQMTKQTDVDFVASMRANFKKYGEHTWCSDKQHTWLRRIAGLDTGVEDAFERWYRR